MTLTLAALTIALGALVPVAATADSCPNAAERFGASANLPDCRAYELVTPMIKEDNDYLAAIHGFPDGNHVAIMSLLPYPGAHNGQIANTMSTRTSSGWVSTSLTPRQGPGEPVEYQSPDNLGLHSFQVSFASDFSAAFVDSPYASDPLDQDGTTDVYRVDIPSGASSLAALPDSGPMTEALANPPGVFDPSGLLNMIGTFVAGNSGDGSHVFFETTVALPTAPGTPAFTPTTGEAVYERYGGHTYLVGVLPDGSVPACGAEIANGGQNASNAVPTYNSPAIAPDGSNFVFRTPGWRACPGGNTPTLYLREHNGTPQARTVELPGDGLLARSADGSKLLTTDNPFYKRSNGNIYVYDIPTGQTTVIGQGELVAFSPDLSHVYYMEGRYQASSGLGTSGTQISLYENGTSKPVLDATAAAGFSSEFFSTAAQPDNYASTTPDGSKLLFLDRANLTSYNSEDPTCLVVNSHIGLKEAHCAEAYLYDAANGSVTCVSCNPNGTPPVASVALFQRVNAHQAEGSIASFIPTEMENLSPDGSRVFFETEEALVPQDTNGVYDVYEREDGHYYLLSSGHGSYGSYLDGVGNNGNDIFIQSTDNLLPQDLENSQLVYDARVGGGFPYTPPVYGCDSGQCQGPQTPAPIFAPPPSSTFSGLGNPVTEEVKPVSVHKATKRKATKKRHKTPPKHKAKKARSGAKSGNFKRRGRK
jgi:hypothetical protein